MYVYYMYELASVIATFLFQAGFKDSGSAGLGLRNYLLVINHAHDS